MTYEYAYITNGELFDFTNSKYGEVEMGGLPYTQKQIWAYVSNKASQEGRRVLAIRRKKYGPKRKV